MEVVIRGATKSDMSFIYSTWLRGVYHGCSYYSKMESRAFYSSYTRLIAIVLVPASVRIACLPTDPDVIIGYAVIGFTKDVIHWVYVKSAFRKQGVAKELLKDVTFDTVTHITDMSSDIIDKKKFKFNPFLV